MNADVSATLSIYGARKGSLNIEPLSEEKFKFQARLTDPLYSFHNLSLFTKEELSTSSHHYNSFLLHSPYAYNLNEFQIFHEWLCVCV